jgi:hypothetical protein
MDRFPGQRASGRVAETRGVDESGRQGEIAGMITALLPEKPPRGRPSLATTELKENICDRISTGESLRAICRGSDMPDFSTIWRWLDSDPLFASKYARAREVQAEVMDGLILKEAEDCTPENAASARVKIDAYKWRASKLAPKVFGDFRQVQHSGELVVETRQTLNLHDLDDDAREEARDLIERMRALSARNVTPGEGG